MIRHRCFLGSVQADGKMALVPLLIIFWANVCIDASERKSNRVQLFNQKSPEIFIDNLVWNDVFSIQSLCSIDCEISENVIITLPCVIQKFAKLHGKTLHA